MADVDDYNVRHLLANIGSKKTSRRLLSCIRKGLQIIAKETSDSFKRNRRGFTEVKIRKKTRAGKKKMVTQKIAKVVVRPKDNVAKVHIMSDYRVKWFEMGTKERETKGRKIVGGRFFGKRKVIMRSGKGHRTGKIKPEWFFKKAIRRKSPEAEKIIEEGMNKVFKSINR